MIDAEGRGCLCRLLIMLAKSVQDASMTHLRRCALQCSIRVTCCARGFDNAVTYVASLLNANKQPRDRQACVFVPVALLTCAMQTLSHDSLDRALCHRSLLVLARHICPSTSKKMFG